MEYQLTYTPSPTFLRQATWRRWRSSYLVPYCLWGAIPALTLVMCLGSHDIPLSGTGGIFIGLLSGMVLTLVAVLAYSYSQTQRTLAKSIAKWQRREITHIFDDQGLSTRTDLSFYQCVWKMVQRAQLTPEGLLLHADERNLVTLPKDQLSEEVQQFIVAKVKEAGGQVT